MEGHLCLRLIHGAHDFACYSFCTLALSEIHTGWSIRWSLGRFGKVVARTSSYILFASRTLHCILIATSVPDIKNCKPNIQAKMLKGA